MNTLTPTKTGQSDIRYQRSEAVPLNPSTGIQVDDLTGPAAPDPDRLSRCTGIVHDTLYAARVTGSAMFSTGLTANICRHMMNNPHPKKSEGLLIGLGILSFLSGAVGQASMLSTQRRESIRKAFKDAVVPALVSFSVYLALSHGAI